MHVSHGEFLFLEVSSRSPHRYRLIESDSLVSLEVNDTSDTTVEELPSVSRPSEAPFACIFVVVNAWFFVELAFMTH